MESLAKNLHAITILYYVFLALFLLDLVLVTIPDFAAGFEKGINEGREFANQARPDGVVMLMMSALALPGVVAFVWSVVIFVKILVCAGVSVYRKDIFNLRCVKLFNRYALLYSIAIILIAVLSTLENAYGAYPEDIMKLYREVPDDFIPIIMMLIMGQILKVGYVLKQEQDLTI